MDITPVGGPSFFTMFRDHYRALRASALENGEDVVVTYHGGRVPLHVTRVHNTKGRAVFLEGVGALGRPTFGLVSDSAAELEFTVVPEDDDGPNPIGFSDATWGDE